MLLQYGLVSFRLFRKNLGHLREFFGQMVYRPPWQKISRTPMPVYRFENTTIPNSDYARDSYILLDGLVCSIAGYFYESGRILASP